MKKHLTILICLLFITLTACQQQAGKQVIIETTSGAITEEDLNKELQKRYGKQVLEDLVMVNVLGEKYDIDEDQVNEELEKLKEELGMQFDFMLKQQGFNDIDDFKEVLYLGMLQKEAALDGIEVTDEQLMELYERKTKEINAQHILVKNIDTAEEILEKIASGEDFSKLAKEYSEDKMSVDDGGDLGYFSAGTMVAPFEDVAFSMEKGEISEPVQTNYGYHIIKLNDIRSKDKNIGTFEEVKEDLRDEILEEVINSLETQVKIEKIIEEAIVDIKDDTYKNLFETFQSYDAIGWTRD